MAELNAKKRNRLPGKDFAVPGREYPVNDASHARNALARVAQFGTAKEKAEVRAKVRSKFPGIEEGGNVKKTTAKEHERKGEMKMMAHKAKGKADERKGEKRMMAHKAAGRRHESRGMKMAMGEHEGHKAVGAHAGHTMKLRTR